ncbi:MAG: type II toxin-antitoxin system VapC family toxin [Gemmatimonadota bacterium]
MAILVRRRRPVELEPLAQAARRELAAGRALLSVVTIAELLVGARDTKGRIRLQRLLESFAVTPVDEELAYLAGRLGSYARRRGTLIPLPDLLIAATAVRLGIPVLTSDGDFDRGKQAAAMDQTPDTDAQLWRSLQIHPAGRAG